MIRRLVSTSALATVILIALGGPVSAHIDPDPTEAQAGSRLTVRFTVEHGCDGSATTQLDMRLPDGVTDAAPEPSPDWDESIETVDGDTIVSFVGGPLADDIEGTFSVSMTLPPTPDTTIYFPFVQRCEVGEIRWIGIPAEPGEELDEPAPAMALIGPVATAAVAEPATATATAATAEPATAEPATAESPSTTSATTEPAAGATEAPSTSEPVVGAADAGEAGNSRSGTIAFILSMAAVLGIGAFVVFRSRQARAGTTTAPG